MSDRRPLVLENSLHECLIEDTWVIRLREGSHQSATEVIVEVMQFGEIEHPNNHGQMFLLFISI